MARIVFRQRNVGRKASLHLATEESTEALAKDPQIDASEHLKKVLSLYSICIDKLMRLRAHLMDKRIDSDAAVLHKHCIAIIEALDDDLDHSVELAQNFHILYQHCLRHLSSETENLTAEHIDAVQMVIARLRHLYQYLVPENSDT